MQENLNDTIDLDYTSYGVDHFFDPTTDYLRVSVLRWAGIKPAMHLIEAYAARQVLRGLQIDLKCLEVQELEFEAVGVPCVTDDEIGSKNEKQKAAVCPYTTGIDGIRHICDCPPTVLNPSQETFEPTWFVRALSNLRIPAFAAPFSSMPMLNSLSLSLSSFQFPHTRRSGSGHAHAHDIGTQLAPNPNPWRWTRRFFATVPEQLAAGIAEVRIDIHIAFPHDLCSIVREEAKDLRVDSVWRAWNKELCGAHCGDEEPSRWSKLKKVVVTVYAPSAPCIRSMQERGEVAADEGSNNNLGWALEAMKKRMGGLAMKGMLEVRCAAY